MRHTRAPHGDGDALRNERFRKLRAEVELKQFELAQARQRLAPAVELHVLFKAAREAVGEALRVA